MIPTIQIIIVLEASQMALVKEFIYLAITTPKVLYTDIETSTMKTPAIISPSLNTSRR
jgi:hypothetical protein